jgi:D-xylose transport system substrate-binding protein
MCPEAPRSRAAPGYEVEEETMTAPKRFAAALFTTALLALPGCGGDNGSGGGGGGGETQGKVGVILPDTESSVRWETADEPLLSQAFEDAGIAYDIQNAEGDAERMATIAEQMITGGVTVLAIVNLDSASGARIEKDAEAQGVQTIDYDRLTLGGVADYYVSFDNVEVGRLQGEGLKQCLGDRAANIAFLNGSPDDNNATLFSQGAHEVLDPVGGYTKVAEQAVPDWDNAEAATIFEQMYTQNNGNIDGVLAANDGLGNAAVSILERQGRAGDVPVTGQDATLEGLQNILAGKQCMTVYKPIAAEADALAETAIALINGEKPNTTGTVTDPEGGREVPSVLLQPVSIFRDNVNRVVEDDFVSTQDLCKGQFEAECNEVGIQSRG